jgi:hydroxypyruvate reductase
MSTDRVAAMRRAMLDAYAAAVAAVEGERVTADWLQRHPFDGPVSVLALGKAAGAMARGAQRALGLQLVAGLVVTKAGHADAGGLSEARWRVVEAAHPVPDGRSLAAGQAVADFVSALPAGRTVLVLVSGGASALAELPVPGIGLETLARVNAWLLSNGLPIGRMNAVRRRLSQLKGGGLARLLVPRPVTGLLISDVEGDDPAVIGSGPLSPPPDTRLPDGLPGWLGELLPDAVPNDLSADQPTLRIAVVACLDDALRAAERTLLAAGHAVRRHTTHFDDDLESVAMTVDRTSGDAPGEVQLWGGEATLVLPEQPGRGGRNQHLALRLAQQIAGPQAAVVLSAGTDGTDGPTEDAGALVDNRTAERGGVEGLSLDAHLRRADAGTYLEQTGDLITTGPTGTNVTDIVMAWRD